MAGHRWVPPHLKSSRLHAVRRRRDTAIADKQRVYRFVLFAVALLVIAAFLIQPGWHTGRETWWATVLAGISVASLIYCTFPYWAARRAFAERRRAMSSYRADKAIEDLVLNQQCRLPPCSSSIVLSFKFTRNSRGVSSRLLFVRRKSQASLALLCLLLVLFFRYGRTRQATNILLRDWPVLARY
jgi:hypothetical protein